MNKKTVGCFGFLFGLLISEIVYTIYFQPTKGPVETDWHILCVLFLVTGAFGAALGVAIQQAVMIWRIRKFFQYCYCDRLTDGLNQGVKQALEFKADMTHKSAAYLRGLQGGGLKAMGLSPSESDDLEMVQKKLNRETKSRMDMYRDWLFQFDELYDLAFWFSSNFYTLSFKERDYKNYLKPVQVISEGANSTEVNGC